MIFYTCLECPYSFLHLQNYCYKDERADKVVKTDAKVIVFLDNRH